MVAHLSGAPTYALISFYWLLYLFSLVGRPNRKRYGLASTSCPGRVQGQRRAAPWAACEAVPRGSDARVRLCGTPPGRLASGVHDIIASLLGYVIIDHCCHPAMSVLADRLNLNNSKQLIDVLLRENKTRQRIQYIRRPHVQHHAQLELLLQLVVGHVDEEVVHRAAEHHDRH